MKKPLVYMGRSGGLGSFFARLNSNTLIRTAGNFLSSGQSAALINIVGAEMLDAYTMRIYFNHSVVFVSSVACNQAPVRGIIFRVNATPGTHTGEVTLPTINAIQFNIQSPVQPGDVATFEYVGTNGCIVAAHSQQPISDQPEYTIPNTIT